MGIIVAGAVFGIPAYLVPESVVLGIGEAVDADHLLNPQARSIIMCHHDAAHTMEECILIGRLSDTGDENVQSVNNYIGGHQMKLLQICSHKGSVIFNAQFDRPGVGNYYRNLTDLPLNWNWTNVRECTENMIKAKVARMKLFDILRTDERVPSCHKVDDSEAGAPNAIILGDPHAVFKVADGFVIDSELMYQAAIMKCNYYVLRSPDWNMLFLGKRDDSFYHLFGMLLNKRFDGTAGPDGLAFYNSMLRFLGQPEV